MKRCYTRILSKAGGVALSIFAMLGANIVYGQTDDSPFTITMALQTGKTIVQGEPIVLKYQISNIADAEKLAEIDVDGKCFISTIHYRTLFFDIV